MVSRPNHPRTPFGRKLAAELERQNVSARELARRMKPHDPEAQRRSIARWLAPLGSAPNPSPSSRRAAAEALGLEPGALDEDEEEAASMRPIADDLAVMFSLALDRALDAKLAARERVA